MRLFILAVSTAILISGRSLEVSAGQTSIELTVVHAATVVAVYVVVLIAVALVMLRARDVN